MSDEFEGAMAFLGTIAILLGFAWWFDSLFRRPRKSEAKDNG